MPEKPTPPPVPEAPPPADDESWSGYAQVLWMDLGLAVLGLGVEAVAGYRAVGFCFLLFVLLLGLLYPLGPVLFGAVLGALTWDLGFIPPRFQLTVGTGEDAMLLFTYLAVAASSGVLTQRSRRLQHQAQAQARRAGFLLRASSLLQAGSDDDPSLLRCLEAAEGRLRLRLGLAFPGPDGRLQGLALSPQPFHCGRSEQALADEALRQGRSLGWEQAGGFSPRLLALPLDVGPGGQALLLCRRDDSQEVDAGDRALLAELAQMLALALQRRRLRESRDEAAALRRSEELHQALFDSLSHELRTPLTTVLTGASHLQAGPADPAVRASLLADLSQAAERLNRTIGNLLDGARLSAGKLDLKPDWQDPAELVSLTLERVASGLAGHRVRLELPADLPLLRVDYRLLEHALSNLLLNAANYSPRGGEILVQARTAGGRLELDVRDQGPGIPAELRERVFDKFYRLPGSPAGGTGLGLHIARALLRAHGGDLAVADIPGPGACFRLSLPLPPEAPVAAQMPGAAA